MKDKVSHIIKLANKVDKKLARQLRSSALDSMLKFAEDDILQHPKGTPTEFGVQKNHTKERGGEEKKKKEHQKADNTVPYVSRSLSTRYSPDRVGVQARRIADGVYQDPITNKTYDWNEGFTSETGEKFQGSRVSLQTDLYEPK